MQLVGGKLLANPIGAIKYSEQVNMLQAILREIYDARLKGLKENKHLLKFVTERVEMGLFLSERTWLEVLQLNTLL